MSARAHALAAAVALAACTGGGDREKPDPEPAPSAREDAGPRRAEAAALAAPQRALSSWEAWEEALAASDPGALAGLYADDAVLATGRAEVAGPARIARYHALARRAFPDRERRPVAVTAARGRVAIVTRARATHEGGLLGVPATGAETERTELTVLRVRGDGAVARERAFADRLNLLAQIGWWEREEHRQPASAGELDPVRAAGAPANGALGAARAFHDHLGARDAEAIAAAFTERGVLHDTSAAADARGRSAVAGLCRSWFRAFPDLSVSELELWGSGRLAVATFRLSGTHRGRFGRIELAPTGGSFDVPAATVIEVKDGAIRRAWWFVDGLAVAEQLGAVPAAD